MQLRLRAVAVHGAKHRKRRLDPRFGVSHFSRGVFPHVLEDEHIQGTLNSFVTRRVSSLVVTRRLSPSAGMAP